MKGRVWLKGHLSGGERCGREVAGSSANGLGHGMDQAYSVAKNSGMPGRTKNPRPWSPMTGSQA